MKTTKKYRVCPICGGDNYRDNDRDNALSHPQYLAAVAALKLKGLPVAEGDADESFGDSVDAGNVDPMRVCSACIVAEDGETLIK
jgi:hypothetical protein